MAERVLTHGQYEELRRYEDGRPHWIFGGPPSKSQTLRDFVKRVPNSGHDRANSMFQITDAGIRALVAYREKYGVRAA